VLGSANTYSGGTTLSSGTLQLGNATALGAVTGPLAVNAGTLDLHDNSVTVGLLSGSNGAVITSNASGAIVLTASSTLSGTFGGQIQNGSGTVGLTQAGAGTLTLSNSNTYTGATIVSAGTLLVSGSLSGSSAVSATTGGILALQGGTIDTLGTTTIANASTLTGNGTVGTLSILAGGTFAPGVVGSSGSGGVITTASNSTFATGAAFGLQISGTGAGQYGQLAAGGQTVTLSGSTQLSINLATGYTPVAGDTFTLILGAGGAVAQDFYSGSTLLTQSASTFTADGFNWQISYDGALGNDATVTNNVDLEVLGAVPEPSTWAMLLGGAGLLGIWRRNRRLTK
jgi:autotransporter-associated beta strand protein